MVGQFEGVGRVQGFVGCYGGCETAMADVALSEGKGISRKAFTEIWNGK